MSWDITVTPPEGYPDVHEHIISCSNCSGNFYMCVLEMKDKQLREMTKDDAIAALKEVIAEIDKGNEGRFSNSYAVEADQKWSGGKEMGTEWDKVKDYISSYNPAHLPYTNYEEFCGYNLRCNLREDAVRFFLYYLSGYQIEYMW